MNMHTFVGNLAVAAFALLIALGHGLLGIRARCCDPPSARLHFLVALASVVVAGLVVFRVASPIVGYALLCLALACFQLCDLLQDEGARRRKVASLVPRPAVEPIPVVWIALVVGSVALLAPYVLLAQERAAALVGMCALVMAGIAWRIASAPVQLHGENVRSERMRDRAWRFRKAGVCSVVAMGSIFAFITFVNSALPEVLPLQRLLLHVSFVTWAASGAWVILYAYRLDRLSRAVS